MHVEPIVWSERSASASMPERDRSLSWLAGVILLSVALITLAVDLAAWQDNTAAILLG